MNVLSKVFFFYFFNYQNYIMGDFVLFEKLKKIGQYVIKYICYIIIIMLFSNKVCYFFF